MTGTRAPVRARNAPEQYDDLADVWWDRRGRLAMLHWLAVERAKLVPPPVRDGAVLVDVACGGGLLAPHVPSGYRHIGVDLSPTAALVASQHGVRAVRADVTTLPFADACADVVVAGEVLEHVPDFPRLIAEVCRILAPGGVLVLDTIAATRVARIVAVTIGERVPGGPPRRLHDPRLFIDRDELMHLCGAHGVSLTLHGLRPSLSAYLAWLVGLRPTARVVRTRSTAILFAGVGVKQRPTLQDAAQTTALS